jgi:hypothetical protein
VESTKAQREERRTHQKCRSFAKYLVRSRGTEEGFVGSHCVVDLRLKWLAVVGGWNSGYFYWLLAKFPFVLSVPSGDDI